MTEEQTTKATEETGKESVLTSRELRQNERVACEKEIAAVLQKYGCELTAQMIVGENRVVPQIFIIDARG